MDILYFTFPLSAVLIFLAALGLGVFLTRKFKLGWRLYWIGAATFILSQVGHIPFNNLLTLLFRNGVLPSPPEAWTLPFNVLVLSLSAGLWEEPTRWAVYRWWAKDARTWKKGVLFGAGHGGIEALIIGGLILITYLNMVILRSSDLSATIPPGELALVEEAVQIYWSTPWYISLTGFVERVLAMANHVALAVIVLQVFLRKQTRWLFLAIGMHTLMNFVAVYISETVEIWAGEAALAVVTLLNLGILLALRRPSLEEPEESQPQPTAAVFSGEMPEVEPNLENLDKTRYQS